MTRAQEKRLLALWRELPAEQRRLLFDFAEFLATRKAPERKGLTAPVAIPRPEKESVVKAIQRLAASYPMLDRATMLNETSLLMSQHVMGGRAAGEVIDELELLFRRHYERLLSEDRGRST